MIGLDNRFAARPLLGRRRIFLCFQSAFRFIMRVQKNGIISYQTYFM